MAQAPSLLAVFGFPEMRQLLFLDRRDEGVKFGITLGEEKASWSSRWRWTVLSTASVQIQIMLRPPSAVRMPSTEPPRLQKAMTRHGLARLAGMASRNSRQCSISSSRISSSAGTMPGNSRRAIRIWAP